MVPWVKPSVVLSGAIVAPGAGAITMAPIPTAVPVPTAASEKSIPMAQKIGKQPEDWRELRNGYSAWESSWLPAGPDKALVEMFFK